MMSRTRVEAGVKETDCRGTEVAVTVIPEVT